MCKREIGEKKKLKEERTARIASPILAKLHKETSTVFCGKSEDNDVEKINDLQNACCVFTCLPPPLIFFFVIYISVSHSKFWKRIPRKVLLNEKPVSCIVKSVGATT